MTGSGKLFAALSTVLAEARTRLRRWWQQHRLRPGGHRSPLPAMVSARTIGPYRIERELGRGSAGAVYLARQSASGRTVALKTIRMNRVGSDDRSTESVRARFLAEARIAACLQHPGIVAIFDVGVSGDVGFIAMELVIGTDLAAHALPDRLLPIRTVLRIGSQCASALAYAHRQGVVHRDIKPANLLWQGNGGGRVGDGTVKLTDFGIARMVEAGGWRTRTGHLLGSPAFTAPEQMAGREVDGRTDLYALGVLLFQLLTGGLPHRSESMGRLLQAIAHQPAPDIRSLRPELPEALARVVGLALQKRPERRYPDGDQMARDLERVLAAMGPEPPTELGPGNGPAPAPG